jgi:hypothetical protein
MGEAGQFGHYIRAFLGEPDRAKARNGAGEPGPPAGADIGQDGGVKHDQGGLWRGTGCGFCELVDQVAADKAGRITAGKIDSRSQPLRPVAFPGPQQARKPADGPTCIMADRARTSRSLLSRDR